MRHANKVIGLVLLAGLALAGLGCGGGGGTYWLTLVYPDQASLEATVSVEVFVIKASEDVSCGPLVSGSSQPTEFDVKATAFFNGANPNEVPEIKGLGGGEVLFFARAKNPEVFLRGCTQIKVGDDVTITMQHI